jgi:hypothetical protein
MIRKLAGRYEKLYFCHEAGPTGYGLYSQVRALGHDGIVVAPLVGAKATGRAGQDQPARCRDTGSAVARR